MDTIHQWLVANRITEVEVLVPDMTGNARGKFVPAEAVIDGATVVVTSKDVSAPALVRFAWNNVANPNLMNKEGLPASPFQTKDWQGGTGE